MPTLGDLLASARHDASAFAGWIAATDAPFARELADAAGGQALEPAGFVRLAIGDFSRHASEEDWATLVSAIRDAQDPGMTCLRAMVDWRIAAGGGCRQHATETVEGIRHEHE